MSWMVTTGVVPKGSLEASLDELVFPHVDAPAFEQFKTAKGAAKLLAVALPGPLAVATLSGHANGVGWAEKPGFANDTITVSVTQIQKP